MTRLLSVLFIFPSRYWYTIGHERVFSLARWCWRIPTGFLRSRGTQESHYATFLILTGLSPSMVSLSRRLQFGLVVALCESYNPKKSGNFLVWAVPISLATTQGITIVFSSSRYLDVSVPWVRFSFEMTSLQLAGLPHSEIYGSQSLCNSP